MKQHFEKLRLLGVVAALAISAASIDTASAFSGYGNSSPEFGGKVKCQPAFDAACFRWDIGDMTADDAIETRQWIAANEQISGIVDGIATETEVIILGAHGMLNTSGRKPGPILTVRYGAAPDARHFDCQIDLKKGDACEVEARPGQKLYYSLKMPAQEDLINFYLFAM